MSGVFGNSASAQRSPQRPADSSDEEPLRAPSKASAGGKGRPAAADSSDNDSDRPPAKATASSSRQDVRVSAGERVAKRSVLCFLERFISVPDGCRTVTVSAFLAAFAFVDSSSLAVVSQTIRTATTAMAVSAALATVAKVPLPVLEVMWFWWRCACCHEPSCCSGFCSLVRVSAGFLPCACLGQVVARVPLAGSQARSTTRLRKRRRHRHFSWPRSRKRALRGSRSGR